METLGATIDKLGVKASGLFFEEIGGAGADLLERRHYLHGRGVSAMARFTTGKSMDLRKAAP